jgi:TIR domain
VAQPVIFLSYSRKDEILANHIEGALIRLKQSVFRDVHSVAAGTQWLAKITEALGNARGVVVLATPASAHSEWVTYEYAFAKGAGIPVVAVTTDAVSIPKPIKSQFQTIRYTDPFSTAERICHGLLAQRKQSRKDRQSTPVLRARFHEVDGEVEPKSNHKLPEYGIDLWVEGAPSETRKIAFEILDEGVKAGKWHLSRGKKTNRGPREFLSNDVSLYGDVDIWAHGVGAGAGEWTIKTTLFESLKAYYLNRPMNKASTKALAQIRDN